MSKSRRVTADATLTSKGQLTLPAPIREAINVRTGDKLRFETAGAGKLVVTPLRRPDVLSLAGVFGEANVSVTWTSLNYASAHGIGAVRGSGSASSRWMRSTSTRMSSFAFSRRRPRTSTRGRLP
ncbi:MAG: AbrB/MazE/SpoVT family DNA-binding domain-containing protein [Chloroflexi bacterium]|nr:MAG: AbrB/MazE/SpoVT family DNA-binding domain-containing protein [Chloroflexota bacterium]